MQLGVLPEGIRERGNKKISFAGTLLFVLRLSLLFQLYLFPYFFFFISKYVRGHCLQAAVTPTPHNPNTHTQGLIHLAVLQTNSGTPLSLAIQFFQIQKNDHLFQEAFPDH